MMEGPSAHNGMTDMEWLEREQEKEMIELAMERSMNEFQAFQHSQPALQAPRGPIEPPLHESMPAMHMHHSYNDHYGSGSRRNINISNHRGHEHHNYAQHRGHDNSRDRVSSNRRNTYNIYSGRYGHRENSMRSLSTTSSPMQQRSLAPMAYSRSGSFRQVQEVTETVIDSPHTSYDPRMGGSSMPSPMYHDSRRHSAQPLHQQYDYRGSSPANAPPYNSMGQSSGYDRRRDSAPAQYHHREDVAPQGQYHDRPHGAGHGRPNMRTPRHEARDAVLETARQHLSEEEALRVEEALNLAHRQQAIAETQHSNASSSYESSHNSRRSPDIHHQRRSSAYTLETMDLLRRAAASDHLSQEEMDQIEFALNEDGNDNDNRQYSPAQHPHDFHHEPHHNLSGTPPPPIQQHYHPDHHYDRQHEHPHDRQYPHHEQEHLHDRQYPHEPQYQQHYHEQHEHPHDHPYLREPERQYSQEDDHPYPHERENQEHHSDHRHAPNRHSEQEGRSSHQIRRDRMEQREAARVVPQARGYRPNPRFAATTPRRTYSQDSVAMAREEIQKGLASNTLSKEEYDELMKALGASDGNSDSDSRRNDNDNTDTNGVEDEGSLTSREREDDYPRHDGHPTGDRDDNYPALPTIRSEDNHPPSQRNGSEDHDYHDDVDERAVPASDTDQASPRSCSPDSSGDRRSRLGNDQDVVVQRSPSPQSSAHENEDLASALVVDDAAVMDMCPPFPESPQGENQQRLKESSLDHNRIPAEDDALSADDVEDDRDSIKLHDEEESFSSYPDAIHIQKDTQGQEDSKGVEARPDYREGTPHHEAISDEEDSKSNEESEPQAQSDLPNRSDLGSDYDDVGSGPSFSEKEMRASYDGTESASSSAVPSRRGSEGALPPSNRQMRLGSSHHSHSHHSQSRHSRRSNSQHLSAALAALPYARPMTQGAAGSISIEMDYSVSQFGDSFATFGSDYMGNQRGDGSSVISSETELSRQNQNIVAFSPKSVSSQTIRGVALLPPPLGGFEEDDREEDDVLQYVGSADLSVSDHTDANQPQADNVSNSESTPEAATRDSSADSGAEEETANKRETFDVASENDVEGFDTYFDRDPKRDETSQHDGHSQDLSDNVEVSQIAGNRGGSLPIDDDKNVAASNVAGKMGEGLLPKDDTEDASPVIDLADSPSSDMNEATALEKSDRPGRFEENGVQDSHNGLWRDRPNQDTSHSVASQDSDMADQHPPEWDKPHEQEFIPGGERQYKQNVERKRLDHEDAHDTCDHEMQLGQDDKPVEVSRVSRNDDEARRCDMQHGQDDRAPEESRVGQDGYDGDEQSNKGMEERRIGRDGDAGRRDDMQHGQDDPRLDEPRGGGEGNNAGHSDIQHGQEDQGPEEQRVARGSDHHRGYEMQHGQEDQELHNPRIGRAGDDVRRYDMQHGQDDPGLEDQRAGRDAYDPETEHNFYPEHQHHWRRQHMRDNRVESERVNRHRWVEDHNGEPSDRNYFRQRQHHSSRMLGRSESDPYERQRRHGGQARKRRSDSEAPEVPQQVQVDPGDLRAAWAANGRSNSVSSLGESTQYSIYSAHFRSAEDYDRYRSEDYERALYEHNNWRQNHPPQLPHTIRESSNPYAPSDHTGSSRRPQQHHLLPPSQSFGFHRENEYDRERPRDNEFDRERPRDNEFDRERPRSVDPISDHDRFDEDLKRALYESMQMQRQSHPQREDDYDEDLHERVDAHEHRLSREKMDHIARALSGPDHMDDARQSELERFEAPSNQFPVDRYGPSNRALPMARDMSDPTHNRVAHQQNEESGLLEANASDLQAARIADDALDRALQEAKDEELARQLQQEDARRVSRARQSQVDSVHLLPNTGRVGAVGSTSPIRSRHPLEAEMTPPNESFRLSSLENEGARRHSSPTPGQRRPGQDYSRRSLEGSYSSLHQSRSSAVGAVHSSSPERVRHPLEESFSSQQRSSRHVGAARSSSPERALHPLEESYSSFGQGRAGLVGAVRSSNPERARHPLEDSYSSLSQGRATKAGAVQSTSPSRARHPLEDSYNSQTSPRRQDDSLRPTAQRLSCMDESLQQSSRSNRNDDSHGSLRSSVQENARRSLDDSYSSQLTPTHPGNAREAQTITPPGNDRTLDPSGSMLSVPSVPSVSEQHGSFLSVPSVPGQRDIELPGLADANQEAFVPPTATKEVAKDPMISPAPGKKTKNRRDSKVFGSVARLGKKGVTSLMQKLGSSRHIGSNHNAAGNLPGNGPALSLSHQMDPETRMQVDRAMMKGILGQLNGVVKFGREATIYHAEKGPESHGFDVAVKVYKRAQGGGSDNQEGNFDLSQFQNISSKEQLEFWTMKEFRNLKRARRAGVPSPLPLHTKNNILFMQFMGATGRPAPQLGELDLRRGNKRWKTLYKQIVEALRRLFTSAELVHGDLNEGNVLVVPRHFIDATVSIDSKAYDADTAVLIDFGQTVDSKHPDAMDLLRSDVQSLRQFFVKQGIRTPSVDDALKFITSGNASLQEQSNNFDDSVNKP